jgi:hypothetical protein
MGVQDRDYMKRSSAGAGEGNSSADAEEFVAGFLQKHPRFFVYLGIGIGALILISAAVVLLSGRGD